MPRIITTTGALEYKMSNKTDGVQYHEELAAQWDDKYRSGSFKKRANLFRQKVLPILPEGGKWLDAGCGSGYFSRILADNSVEIIGVDASSNMVKEAQSRITHIRSGGTLRFENIKTIEKLPFNDEYFDGCICLSVLEYLTYPMTGLDELVRILKPGGHLVLSIPHKHSALRWLQHRIISMQTSGINTNLSYLKTSQYLTSPNEIQSTLTVRNMKVIKNYGFDAIIPSLFHKIFYPSLIYIVAQKC